MRRIEDIVCIYNPKPVNYSCGNNTVKMLKASIVANPYEILPTEGEHDYKICDNCQEFRKLMIDSFQSKSLLFPNCCDRHRRLLSIPGFSINAYQNIAEITADKVIFAYQHILNKQDNSDWKTEIKDYLDYFVDSFGAFPEEFGEPFLISSSIDTVQNLVKNNKGIRREVCHFVEDYFEKLKHSSNNKDPFQLLFSTYDKWLKLFPFDISLFRDLKEVYSQRSPLFFRESKKNPFYGGIRYSLITPPELVEVLCKITSSLLSDVSAKQAESLDSFTSTYYKELISQELRVESIELLSLKSESYVVIIKKWIAHQQEMCKKLSAFSQINGIQPADVYPNDSYKESILRIRRFKQQIEDKGSNRLFEKDQSEQHLQQLFKLFFNNTTFCVDREVNNGRGPADFKISKGANDCTIIEFKLASNNKISYNIKNQVNIYCKANDTVKAITVIAYFNEKERNKVENLLKKNGLYNKENYILINCQPKVSSASNIK